MLPGHVLHRYSKEDVSDEPDLTRTACTTALVSSDLDRPQKLAQAPGEEDEREGDHERDRRVGRRNRSLCATTHAKLIGRAVAVLEAQGRRRLPT
jgi:hypothetical protein